jgi:hypothetical protein
VPKKGEKASPKQAAVLREHAVKPGQVLNPTGRNGWTAMRERFRIALDQDLDTLTEKLIEVAKEGDVQALRLALGPVVDVRSIQISGPDGAPINFAEIAARAEGETDG